jgi:hypothetical protein
MRIAVGLILIIVMAIGPSTAGAQISDQDNAAAVQYPDIQTREEAPSEGDALPFTGFVAIPLLVTGAVLLGAGGVMHVRTRQRD